MARRPRGFGIGQAVLDKVSLADIADKQIRAEKLDTDRLIRMRLLADKLISLLLIRLSEYQSKHYYQSTDKLS